jgi:hypothetical protein
MVLGTKYMWRNCRSEFKFNSNKSAECQSKGGSGRRQMLLNAKARRRGEIDARREAGANFGYAPSARLRDGNARRRFGEIRVSGARSAGATKRFARSESYGPLLDIRQLEREGKIWRANCEWHRQECRCYKEASAAGVARGPLSSLGTSRRARTFTEDFESASN